MLLTVQIRRRRREARLLSKHATYIIHARVNGVIVGSFYRGTEIK